MIRHVELHTDLGETASEIEQHSARIGSDTSRRDHVIGEPAAALRRQVIVANAAAARARVNDAIAPRVDRDVVYATVLLEHHEIARRDRVPIRRDRLTDFRLLV